MDSFAIVFDMDGVIVDSNPAHKRSLVAFCRSKGFDLTEEQLREKIYGRTNKDWITNLFGKLPAERLQAYAEEKEAMYRETFADEAKPLPGLIAFLEEIERLGLKRAVGTSAPPANVSFTFEKTGVGRFFETVLDDTYIAVGKPNPEIYLKCAAALGVEPARCVVFEDSISGVKAGVGAGAKVVGVSTTHTEEELKAAGATSVWPDFQGKKVTELEGLFA